MRHLEDIIHKACEDIETYERVFSCNAIKKHDTQLADNYVKFIESSAPFENWNDTYAEVLPYDFKSIRILMMLLFLETYEDFYDEYNGR